MTDEIEVPGLDIERVHTYLVRHTRLPVAGHPLAAELLSGGRSNLTYRISCGERAWVLRRPPLGHVLPTAHDMTREYTVLRALHASGFPVPEPLAYCADELVLGVPFFVMGMVDGLVVRSSKEASRLTMEQARRVSRSLVETLARLHSLDVAEIGLSGFGRPDGFLERQVRRWSEQWARSATRPLAEMDELGRRLANAIPVSPIPGVIHGDYRLDNTVLDANDPGRIVAVLDWEMSTIGDPLTDLGLLVVYWTDYGEAKPFRFTTTLAHPGFLKKDELADVYAAAGGCGAESLDFYVVNGYYKLAVILEGIYARFLQGKAVGEDDLSLAGADVPLLAQMALDIAAGSSIRALRGQS